MNKIKTVFIIFVFILVLILLALFGFVWYHFFDVSHLTLYSGENINDIIIHFEKVYVITDDGKAYVAGGYSDSEVREYQNSELTKNKWLKGNPSPVLFFDGVVKTIFPCEDGSIMFTDNSNNLYVLQEVYAQKIANNIIYSAKSKVTGDIYAVDESHNLIVIGNGEPLLSGVSIVKTCGNKIFVLLDNGDLCEYTKDGLSVPIFSSVRCFEVVDTSEVVFDGSKFILNDTETAENPLINVLTFNGELYAKGSYNLIYESYMNNQNHLPNKISEWTLIGNDVNDFSLAGMGTIMVFKDKSCAYFGFDTTYAEGSEMQYRYFDITNVEGVCATNCHVLIKTSNKFYFLGNQFRLFFGRMSDEHHIITGNPYILDR